MKFQIYMILESVDDGDDDENWIDTDEHAAVDVDPLDISMAVINLEVADKILEAAAFLIGQAAKIAAEDSDGKEEG